MKFPVNFIRTGDRYNTLERHVNAPYFRKSFVSQGETVNILIGACGFYELYVNGRRCTKGALAPYISNPDDMVYFDSYDLTLEPGENVIGVLLGNGFQNNPGGYIWQFDQAPFRGAPQFALSVNCGDEVLLEADTTWRTAPSPITFDDYRFGEHYDARLEIHGWNELGFDDSGWGNAISAPKPRGEKRLCQAEPIIVRQSLKPVSITPAEGGYRYDFGYNCAGVCTLKIKGTPGQRIGLRHGEYVKPDNTLDLEKIWFFRDPELIKRDTLLVHQDYYTCKGAGEETYTPCFTYHGFRYVQVTGITPEQATEDLLTYQVMHTDLKRQGSFSCSDPVVNKLHECTLRSDLANFYYFPTDCPHREKNGWTADAALSLEQMLLNFNVQNSLQEWQRNVCKAQADNGALPGIVPTGGWGFKWGNGPAWDCVLAYIPFYTYKYRGELDTARESQAALMRYLNYLTTRMDERGLLKIGLGDWCQVDRVASRYEAPLEFTDSVIAMDIAEKSAILFEALGALPQRDFAKAIAENLRQNVRAHLIDFDTMTAIGNCQTTQAMGIYYGIFEENEKQQALEVLLGQIHKRDDHFHVGVLGGRVIFHVLAQNGYAQLAHWMITRPDHPSYGSWLQSGATTLWEVFRSAEEVASRNHHFWGDTSNWFVSYIAGMRINPTGTDVNHVDIAPCFIPGMDYADATYQHPNGELQVTWNREGDTVTLNVSLPDKLHGEIRLPDGATFPDGTDVKQIETGTFIIYL